MKRETVMNKIRGPTGKGPFYGAESFRGGAVLLCPFPLIAHGRDFRDARHRISEEEMKSRDERPRQSNSLI